MGVLISQTFVVALGVVVIVLAAWGLFAPEKLVAMVTSAMDQSWGMVVAVVVRLALGVALIIAAPVSRFPVAFQVIGAIAIVAAVALLIMGRERTRRFLDWWLQRFSGPMIRLWLLFGIAVGGFLVYGPL